MEENIIDKRYIRSPSDVKKKVQDAKLSNSQLCGSVQTIFFAEDGLKDYKLLELNNDLFEEILNQNSLIIKGEGKENLVLCTNEKTFELKEAETSNSLVIIPDLETFDSVKDNDNEQICKQNIALIKNEYLEVKVTSPRTLKLYDILKKSMYSGPENEYKIEREHLFSMKELIGKVQASEREIKRALIQLKAFEINGFVRILEFNYLFRVLSFMLDLIKENSWKFDEIEQETTMNSLKEFIPSFIVQNMFEYYTEPIKRRGEQQLYKYNEKDVCRTVGQALLKAADRIHLDDFLMAWKDSVPDDMIVDECMLEGVAIFERSTKPNCVYLFLEEELPEDVHERFERLFKAKTRWTKDEIAPYLRRFATKDSDINILLMDNCRGYNENGIRYYSAKFG